MLTATRLRTEYLYEPIGLDIMKPRFYWNCKQMEEITRENQKGRGRQTAYQIVVLQNGSVVWDSGKVISGSMTHISYEGRELKSRDRMGWKVRLWDENDCAGDYVESFFEMGLLKPEDWTAKWISGNYIPEKDTRYPVDCFCRKFKMQGDCRSARLYVSACGLYEIKINGKKAGQDCFTPGCTDYRKRLQYQTYDVTELIEADDENVLEAELADGWYRGSVNAFGQTEVYGNQTKLICQLELAMQDGSRQVIVSDKNFAWSNDGPLRFADFKDGEIYDAAKYPSYSGQAAEVDENLTFVASNNVPVREKEVFVAKKSRTPSGKHLLDFGQNIAGFVDIRMKGKKGQKLFLRMGEILDEAGELTLENIQTKKPEKNFDFSNQIKVVTGQYDQIEEKLVCTPKQEIELILSGGEDHYRTKYALFGFRYAEVVSDEDVDAESFKAVAVYSDMEPLSSFECSNEKVNQFYQNTVWSMKGNYLDIPTDCPTRERLGWTGDAQIFFQTAAYLMDTSTFFRKWLWDMQDGQYENGSFPAVIPYAGLEMMYRSTGSSVGWQDAGILIPYRYYQCYRDERILRQCYPMMQKCASFMIENAGPMDDEQQKDNPYRKYMYVKGVQLGEWLEPKEFNEPVIPGKMAEHPEECTAYMHYSMNIMAQAASTLGRGEDEALYKEYADGAKKAYQWMFLKDGAPDTDRQAKLVRPLALGLAEDSDVKPMLQARLVKAVENYHYHVGTGFLSTAFLLPELTKMGRTDIAYKMLENEEMPGWLAEVNAGATTVWENWEGDCSRNHYSPGAVCEWLFQTVGGIRVDGENHFHIEPIPGGSLTFAKVSYKSIYGEVEVKWNKEGELSVVLPANTSADVVWDGKSVFLS